MEDTRNAPTADSMTADAEQITQAQEPPTVTPATSGHIEAQDAQRTPSSRKRRKDNTSAAAHNRYARKSYERLILQVKSGEKEKIQQYAAEHGLTLNALLIEAVNAYCGDIITPLAKNPYI